MRRNYNERSLCDTYRLPTNLVPLFVEQNHFKSKLDFEKAFNFICDSQIKWLLKRGWIPPQNNGEN